MSQPIKNHKPLNIEGGRYDLRQFGLPQVLAQASLVKVIGYILPFQSG